MFFEIMMDPGFDMFDFMDFFVPIFFLIVFGIMIFNLVRSLSQWSKNNSQPKLNVIAKVVTKRSNTKRNEDHRNTTYYVTFEVESGDRMELRMSGMEYGMIAEGDVGQLQFQGTRYLGFERIRIEGHSS